MSLLFCHSNPSNWSLARKPSRGVYTAVPHAPPRARVEFDQYPVMDLLFLLSHLSYHLEASLFLIVSDGFAVRAELKCEHVDVAGRICEGKCFSSAMSVRRPKRHRFCSQLRDWMKTVTLIHVC